MKTEPNSELKRVIGPGTALALVIANMVGTGIFTTSGFIIQYLGDPLVLLVCWAVGGLVALSGALCYGELAARYPAAGGDYVFLRESFGRLPGFLSGWISLIVGFSAPIAASAFAFAEYLLSCLPGGAAAAARLPFVEMGPLSISGSGLIALVVVGLFSAAHQYSLRFGSRVQNALTLFKLLVMLGFITAAFFAGHGSWEHLSVQRDDRVIFSPAFAMALIFVSFAYSGWNAAAYLGGEIRDPRRNLPLALVSGTLVVILLYLLMNAVFIYALPPAEMAGAIDVGARSAKALFGERFGRAFALAVSLCLLSVISAMIMAGPRVYYAMARDGLFFRRIARVNPRHGTPAASIWLQAGIAGLMLVTASFEALLVYMGFTLSLFAALTVTGLFVVRRSSLPYSSAYRTPGYPLTPLVFIAANLWIVYYCIRENPAVALCGAVTLLFGCLAYLWFRRSGAPADRSG